MLGQYRTVVVSAAAAAVVLVMGALFPGAARAATPLESLLGHVPADAALVVVAAPGAFGMIHDQLKRSPEMQRELAEELRKRAGVDLTSVDAVVLTAGDLSADSDKGRAAILLRVKGGGALKGKAAGAHRGVRLVRLDDKTLAARVGPLVVMGTPAGVRQAIDLHKGHGKALGPGAPLAVVREVAARPGVSLLAALHGPAIPEPDAQKLIGRFGLGTAVATLDAKRTLTVEVHGRPAGLQLAKVMLDQVIATAESKLELERNQARAGDDAGKALGAIVAYHQFRRLVDEARPRVEGSKLVSRYTMPSMDAPATMAGVVGILAAVAIPAFVKYTRKAKTTEARANLYKIRASLQAHLIRERAAGLPDSTPWSPARRCCEGPGGTCAPQPSDFAHPTWKALGFSMGESHRYQYRVLTSGKGKQGRVTIEARGDLDCDGQYSAFSFSGRLRQGGRITFGPMRTEHETE